MYSQSTYDPIFLRKINTVRNANEEMGDAHTVPADSWTTQPPEPQFEPDEVGTLRRLMSALQDELALAEYSIQQCREESRESAVRETELYVRAVEAENRARDAEARAEKAEQRADSMQEELRNLRSSDTYELGSSGWVRHRVA